MELKEKKEAFNKWAKAYTGGMERVWPNETLTRMLKGPYIPDMSKDFKEKKIMDVGCGTGNNLFLYASLGMELYGCEVHEDIVRLTKEKLDRFGYKADLKVGQNRNIPFPNDFFDYLVSWNVLHYEDTEQKIKEAIIEYARVLKKGGRMFFSTTGPQHMILNDADVLGNHRYLIGSAGEFRRGEVYFYFDTPKYIEFYFSGCFENIQVGRVNDFLFTAYQDYFIVTATKK